MLDIGLRQLESLIAVAETGSFVGASERLHITQSTVSMHVKELERIIGAELITRGGRRETELTPLGRDVYAEALSVVRRCEAIENIAADGGLRRIVIAASTVPAHSFLPELMSGFARQEPDVRFEVRATDSGGVFERLLSGAARIGFAGALPGDGGLVAEPVMRDTLVLVTAPEERFLAMKARGADGLEVLKDTPLITRETDSGTQRAADAFLAAHGFGGGEPALRTDDPEAQKRAVARGLGAAVLSELTVREETAVGKLLSFPLGKTPPVRELYLVLKKDVPLTAREMRFAAWVRRRMAEQSGKLS